MDIDLDKYISFKEYSHYHLLDFRIDSIKRSKWYKEYSEYILNELHEEPCISFRGRYGGDTYIHWLIACYLILSRSSPRTIHRTLAFLTEHNKCGVEYFKVLINYHDITIENERTKKYIYFIKDTTNGITKIGMSKNPSKRIKALQNGNPFKLKLEWKISTYNADEIEIKLHELACKYDGNSHEGEWFKLNNNHLEILKKYVMNHRDLYDEIYKDDEFIP